MKTVVQFCKNASPSKGGRNDVFTRTLRKVGFVDNRAELQVKPRAGEYWLVEIVRENRNKGGGCFIIKPLERVSKESLSPLVHGMYEMTSDEDSIILTPHDQSKLWVMSPKSKRMLMWDGMLSVVINQGGSMWSRRKPPEDIVEHGAKLLLEGLSDED